MSFHKMSIQWKTGPHLKIKSVKYEVSMAICIGQDIYSMKNTKWLPFTKYRSQTHIVLDVHALVVLVYICTKYDVSTTTMTRRRTTTYDWKRKIA